MRRHLPFLAAAALALGACGQDYQAEFEAEQDPAQNAPTTGAEAAAAGTALDTFGTVTTDTLAPGSTGAQGAGQPTPPQ